MTAYGGPVYTQRVDDGLSVLVRPLPGVAAAATCLHFGVGFRNEPVAGVAHLCSFSASSSGYTEQIASIGGSTNARTALDYTQYLEVLPAGGLGVALRLELSRMAEPLLAAARVREQIAVVQ
jgi:predicted Zn-dependent peptidase